MKIAVIDNQKIINIIVADSLAIAEAITGKTCIDITDGLDPSLHLDGGEFISRPVTATP
jgi:hypothetical protein